MKKIGGKKSSFLSPLHMNVILVAQFCNDIFTELNFQFSMHFLSIVFLKFLILLLVLYFISSLSGHSLLTSDSFLINFYAHAVLSGHLWKSLLLSRRLNKANDQFYHQQQYF